MSAEEQKNPSAAPGPYDPNTEVLVIPRAVFNYIVVAIVFLAVGVVIGLAMGSRQAQVSGDARALIDEAVNAALAAQSGQISELVAQAVASARPPSLDDPNSRFTVSASDDDPFQGPADAAVTLIEFSDFNCGYCGRWANNTLGPLVAKYGDRVRFVYRDFPILAETSVTAALAAQCAADQGQFWAYHNILFRNQGRFSTENLVSYASELSLNVDEFRACLEDQRHLSRIAADYQAAQALGVRGTPAFFINGRPISGAQPQAVFERIIEEELAAAQAGG